jgi:3-deoxy-7-phosphoheptulonate synthase
MIDASHGNSRKQFQFQVEVMTEVARQVAQAENRIVGAMVESNLVAGRQDLVAGKPLEYGVSITDGCIGWDDTVRALEKLAAAVRERRLKLAQAD